MTAIERAAQIAPQSPPPTYSLDELAEIFRVSAATMTNKLPALYQAGFPKKLPGQKLWSRFAVLRWFETNGETWRPAETAARLAAASAELEAEYAS